MPTVILPPNSDVGPNDGTATPSGPHYLNLDDEPNDGNTSYVQLGFATLKEVCGLDVSAIPDGALVTTLRVRWAAKSGASPCQGRAGLRIAGAYFFGPATALGAPYAVMNETIAHPDGLPWTRERIAAVYLAMELFSIDDDTMIPRPRFTELVGLADIILPPERPVGFPDDVVGTATPAPVAPSSTAQPIVGGSSQQAITPSATGAPLVASAPFAPVVGSGTAAAVAPSAPISNPGKPSAIPASMDPTATPSPVAPLATAAVIRPEGQVS